MKKLLICVLALLFPATCLGCSTVKTEKTVKIGVFEPASGDNGAGGKQETLGILYANSQTKTVEIGGEPYRVELETVDNESATDKAPTAAQNLLSRGVSVVLGSYGSGVSIAAADIFARGGVPAIGISCTNPQVTAGNETYFRICFLDPFQGTVLANFARDYFKAEKAYCLSKLGDDYSGGLVNYFVDSFQKAGGEVVSEAFQEGNSDFTSYITKAKNEGADIFYAPVSTEAAALLVDQASYQGLTVPILAGDTWDSNVILNAAKGKNVQIYVTTFYQEGANPEFDAGVKAWMQSDPRHIKNNGGDVGLAAMTAMGYDAYFVALEAMKKADSVNPGDILSVLGTVKYEGVSGSIAFDENGDAIRDRAYVKTADTESGSWKFVAEQTVR